VQASTQRAATNKHPIYMIKEDVEEQKSANYNNKSTSAAKYGHEYFLNTNKRRRELFRQQNLHTIFQSLSSTIIIVSHRLPCCFPSIIHLDQI